MTLQEALLDTLQRLPPKQQQEVLDFAKFLKHKGKPEAASGFQQLITARTRLITPVPILFEVYKWLLYRGSARIAWNVLDRMQSSFYLMPRIWLSCGGSSSHFPIGRAPMRMQPSS